MLQGGVWPERLINQNLIKIPFHLKLFFDFLLSILGLVTLCQLVPTYVLFKCDHDAVSTCSLPAVLRPVAAAVDVHGDGVGGAAVVQAAEDIPSVQQVFLHSN